MVVATERGRDAVTRPTPRHRKARLTMQLQSTTSPLFGDPRLPARFWKKAQPQPNGCWLWSAALNREGGYGVFYAPYVPHRRMVYAHRHVYETLVGEIGEGLQIAHLCRVRRCVNPQHLEPVTLEENNHRAARVRRHCRNDHQYTIDTVYFYNTKRYGVQRGCRVCQKQAWRRVNLRRKLGLVAR